MKTPSTFRPKLEFTKIQVHLVYGFVATATRSAEFDEWFDAALTRRSTEGAGERSGWTPMYRLPEGADAVVQARLPLAQNVGCDAFCLSPPPTWDEDPFPPIDVDVGYSYALKRSGAGALTISLTCPPPPDGSTYTTSHVLALLLSAPRTEHGLPGDRPGIFDWNRELARLTPRGSKDTLAGFVESVRQAAAESLLAYLPDVSNAQFSPAYLLFVLGMYRFLRSGHSAREEGAAGQPLFTWKEMTQPRSANGKDDAGIPPSLYGGVTRDPQIPYMYVVGNVPNYIYFESFSERADLGVDYVASRRLRSRFTKDIAAILNRWLLDSNIPYASSDQLEREGMTSDGVFLSYYMNSLLFTAFSGIAALTLRPAKLERNRDGLPTDPAIDSILQFVEFSRMRWHQGISINRCLDRLITLARDANPAQVSELMKALLDQRIAIAGYMQNPITYRWDATVGSAVARFIHDAVIGRLEQDTINKLELVKQILTDRLDIIESAEILSSLAAGKPED